VKNKIIWIIQSLSKGQRQKKITLISDDILSGKKVLDIGVWCKFPEPNPSENWLEKCFSEASNIYALGLDPLFDFSDRYRNVKCIQGNGCLLPFKDNSFDVIFSNAVLEHISHDMQKDFISEISRVSKKKAVITVPDRLSPIEIHSKIFFLHWFPNWRRLFELIGERTWSNKEYLSTIFSYRSLENLLNQNTKKGSWKIKRLRFLGIPVSLIATLTK
jgi:hypothetical protein